MNYDNTNRGKIWKVEQKRNPKEPDYKIDLNFEGLDLAVAVWKRAPDANPKAPPWTFKIERKSDVISSARRPLDDEDPWS